MVPAGQDLRARPLSGATGVGDVHPAALRLYPAHPNPLSGETWLGFDLPGRGPVSLEIFDLSGRRVSSLASGVREAGRYQTSWRPLDASGERIAGGLYFARLSVPGRVERLVVLP